MQIATNVWYVKNILANCDGNVYLPIAHLPRVDESCQKNCTVWQGLYTCMLSIPIFTLRTSFFILPNRFLPLWNQRKKLAAQPGIDLRPSGTTTPPQHHRDSSILPKPFRSLLIQLSFMVIYTAGGRGRSRSSLLRPWIPQPSPLHHPGKGWTSLVFLLYLILFFHSETDWKKELVA